MPSTFRKKRDSERKERTRRELLKAATKVFARNGYHNTLVSDIVAQAGVGQGTFYRHFQNKREIFEALLDRFISELLNEFSDMSAHLPTNVTEYRQASLTAISRAARIVERNRELCLLFIREAPTVEDIAEVLAGMYDRMAGLAKFYLDHAVANGFARPCNSEVVSQAIIGMGMRLVEAWLNRRYPESSPEELIKEVVDFVFQGLGDFTKERTTTGEKP